MPFRYIHWTWMLKHRYKPPEGNLMDEQSSEEAIAPLTSQQEVEHWEEGQEVLIEISKGQGYQEGGEQENALLGTEGNEEDREEEEEVVVVEEWEEEVRGQPEEEGEGEQSRVDEQVAVMENGADHPVEVVEVEIGGKRPGSSSSVSVFETQIGELGNDGQTTMMPKEIVVEVGDGGYSSMNGSPAQLHTSNVTRRADGRDWQRYSSVTSDTSRHSRYSSFSSASESQVEMVTKVTDTTIDTISVSSLDIDDGYEGVISHKARPPSLSSMRRKKYVNVVQSKCTRLMELSIIRLLAYIR